MRANSLNLFDTAFLAALQESITPNSFGPPSRWWDADTLRDDYGLTNDALITSAYDWRDLSPNGIGAASTTGNEPTFRSSEINTRPAVRFTGTTHMLFSGGDLVMGDFTILCVARSTLDSMVVSRDGFNRQIRTNRNNEARSSWFSGVSGSELVSNLFLSNLANPRMIGYRRIDNATVPLFHFFDNTTKVDPTTGQGGTVNAAFGINQVGIIDGGPLNIDIAELVIYNVCLSDSEIQILYNQYFKPKFALP